MPIVIASNNLKKTQELVHLFATENIHLIPQTEFQIESVPETGLTFVENAIIKARHASKLSGLPAIGDDSGLEVDALAKNPGIYSARYAGLDANDEDNITRLLKELRQVPPDKRQARYQCVVVYMKTADDPTPIICQGTWEGTITMAKSGINGFGYDPIFWLSEYNCTVAELPFETKNKISHRAKAIQKLIIEVKNII
jgi:XTP/dITP diphosphohydrolase